jgi:single-strand DNA-binding protein
MKPTINTTCLIGNSGNKPETGLTPDGTLYCKISLATDCLRRNDDGLIKAADWHRIIFWRGMAVRAIQEIKCGSRVSILGRLKYRLWIDENGVEHKSAEVWADNFETTVNKPPVDPTDSPDGDAMTMIHDHFQHFYQNEEPGYQH